MAEANSAAGRPRVFVTRRIPDEGLAPILASTDAAVWPGELPPPRAELLAAVAGCEGILAMVTDRIDDELLDAAGPQLRVVSNYAVGVDNIDVAACTRRGIPVGNTPGVLTETTADLTWALLMAWARRIVDGADYVRDGQWKTWGPLTLLGVDVHGSTLGIVGFGRIGQAVARRAAGFGMRVLYFSRTRAPESVERSLGATFVPFETLLAESDFVSIHCALTAETRGLIGERELGLMKRSGVLINAARGPIVSTSALLAALQSGAIAGAALDVTDPEPIPADHPLVSEPTCLIVPHMGSGTRATRGLMASKACANLLAGVGGSQLPDCVNPEVYGRG